MGQRVDALHKEVVSKLEPLLIVAPTYDASISKANQVALSSGTGVNQQTSSKSSPYSQMVSKGLSDVVKSAVVETMAWQKVDDQAKYAVALYDIPERGNDLKSVYSIMRKAGSTATVRNHRRIGRATHTGSAAGAKRVRLLRWNCTRLKNVIYCCHCAKNSTTAIRLELRK